jgi:hypothetical protein
MVMTWSRQKLWFGDKENIFLTAQRKHRILLIGDGHVRGYAEGLSDKLRHSFKFTGYVNPNVDLDTIMIQQNYRVKL